MAKGKFIMKLFDIFKKRQEKEKVEPLEQNQQQIALEREIYDAVADTYMGDFDSFRKLSDAEKKYWEGLYLLACDLRDNHFDEVKKRYFSVKIVDYNDNFSMQKAVAEIKEAERELEDFCKASGKKVSLKDFFLIGEMERAKLGTKLAEFELKNARSQLDAQIKRKQAEVEKMSEINRQFDQTITDFFSDGYYRKSVVRTNEEFEEIMKKH